MTTTIIDRQPLLSPNGSSDGYGSGNNISASSPISSGSDMSLPVLNDTTTTAAAPQNNLKSSSSSNNNKSGRPQFPFAVQDPNVVREAQQQNASKPPSAAATPSSSVGFGYAAVPAGGTLQHSSTPSLSSSAAHTPSKQRDADQGENVVPRRSSGLATSSSVKQQQQQSHPYSGEQQPLQDNATERIPMMPTKSNNNNNNNCSSENPLLDELNNDKGSDIIPIGEIEEDGQERDGDEEEEPEADQVADADAAPAAHHKRVNLLYKSAIFAVIPVFAAYGALVSMQRELKNKIGITDAEKERSDLFGIATSCTYIGNSVMRISHSVVLSFLEPKQRVMLSYTVLALAAMTLVLAYWVFNSTSLAWVFIAYLLGGVGVGTFESNLLSSLSPLGHGTKSWAVLGIPLGFNLSAIGFYILFAIWPDLDSLHAAAWVFVAAVNVMGLVFWCLFPHVDYEGSHESMSQFREHLQHWREWLPKTAYHCAVLCIDMFAVSAFSSIVYFIYDADHIPLWPYAEKTIPRGAFQVWFNAMNFLGDFTGRRIGYYIKPRKSTVPFLILSFVGGALVLSKVSIAAPFGIFFIMLMNGFCYCCCTKWVDAAVDDRYILVALSVWLFVGDLGSSTAALLVQPVQIWIGGVPNATGYHPPNATTMAANVTMAAAGQLLF